MNREPGTGNGGAGRRRALPRARDRKGPPDLRLAESACNRPRPRSPFSVPRPQTGFTLIEVLLATVLLAAGLALAFASLRAATGTTQRGEALAERSERMRAVQGFLRRRIAGARPIIFSVDASSGVQSRFSGDAGGMRFVADLPDYLGRGGPYLHELAVERAGEGVALTVALTLVQAGEVRPETPPRPPEALAEDMQGVRFRYRGLTPENTVGDWQDRWEDVERLPLQVEVLLRDGQGRDWPRMVVALPLSASGGAAQPVGLLP